MSARIRTTSTALAIVLAALVSACASLRSEAPVNGTAWQAPSGATKAVLALKLPDLDQLAPGAEFTCQVPAQLTGVYQGCFRLHYDSTVLEAVSVTRGTLLPADCLFIATPRAQGTAYADAAPQPTLDATIPCAWTLPPNDSGAITGNGALLAVEFKLLKRPAGTSTAIAIDTRPQYLQAYGRAGKAACSVEVQP